MPIKEKLMKLRLVLAASLCAALSFPIIVEAQGLVGGAEEGAHEGHRAAGPVGGVVGGVIGAGVGTVNGALGIRPHYHRYHGRRCYWRHGYRHCY
jgi:hypothetical protein